MTKNEITEKIKSLNNYIDNENKKRGDKITLDVITIYNDNIKTYVQINNFNYDIYSINYIFINDFLISFKFKNSISIPYISIKNLIFEVSYYNSLYIILE